MKIRYVTPADHAEIAPLLRAAFPDEDIATFVQNLRDAGEFLGEWVAEQDGMILGHIGFARAELVMKDVIQPTTMLTPLAVLPMHQSQGIGGNLVNHAHADPVVANLPVQIILGHPTYYPRFGYHHDPDQPITCKWSHFKAFMIRGELPGPANLRISKIIEDG